MINTDLNEIKRQNLVRLMKERRLKSVELARMIGREPPYIAAILKPTGEKGSRNIGPKIMKIVCERLEVGESEFYKGMGLPLPEKYPRPIPVISWVHAGLFGECVDMWPPGVSGVAEPVFSYAKTSENAFALSVEGDSMMPRFMPGDIAIVDPHVGFENGSACVIWVNGEVSLKLVWDREEEVLLRPMNDKYPEMIIRKDSKVDFRVIGRVVDIKTKL